MCVGYEGCGVAEEGGSVHFGRWRWGFGGLEFGALGAAIMGMELPPVGVEEMVIMHGLAWC